MAKAHNIVKEPDKVLRKKAQDIPVRSITTPKIQNLLADMKAALKKTSDGIGIAAPQVGVSLRIYVASEEAEAIDKGEVTRKIRNSSARGAPQKDATEKKDWKYYVFINPVVKKISKKKADDVEGCLSVPGKFGVVRRSEKVTVEAYDEYGKKFTRGTSKLFARLMQHELDHLEGILFIDKAHSFFEPQ
jgi:peptide deformylase